MIKVYETYDTDECEVNYKSFFLIQFEESIFQNIDNFVQQPYDGFHNKNITLEQQNDMNVWYTYLRHRNFMWWYCPIDIYWDLK